MVRLQKKNGRGRGGKRILYVVVDRADEMCATDHPPLCFARG